MHFLLVFIGVSVVKLRVAEGEKGPNGEEYCWWQVTVKGGRETRDMDAITLARVSRWLCVIILIFSVPRHKGSNYVNTTLLSTTFDI
jgi:imidazole glycerol phosphate synthase subunit HisF